MRHGTARILVAARDIWLIKMFYLWFTNELWREQGTYVALKYFHCGGTEKICLPLFPNNTVDLLPLDFWGFTWNCLSNYCPVSLFLICSKVFEKLTFICLYLYDFSDQNCLLNLDQSHFSPDDSCIHQSLAITHIFTVFDANPSVFLNELKNNGIDGNFQSLIESSMLKGIKEFFVMVILRSNWIFYA